MNMAGNRTRVSSLDHGDSDIADRIDDRAGGRYFQMLSYRGTEEQKELIDFAADQERMSIQKLLEGIIMPALEERYGLAFDGLPEAVHDEEAARADEVHDELDDVVVQFNTRIALRYRRRLDEVRRTTGRTLRDLIETAVDQTYGR